MKKVIIPFDGNHFSKGAFSFALSLHQIKAILLTGIFLPETQYVRFFLFPSAFSGPIYVRSTEHSEESEIDNNIEQFSKLCEKNFIEYRVHKDLYDGAIPGLKKETCFADLMIIGSEIFYKGERTYGTNEYLNDALHNTECPVIITPENFDFPSEIVLAYDGSASSVFAIKQFALLFPELCDLKTTLLYAGTKDHNIPDQQLIEELAARHFTDLTITKLTSEVKRDINKWFDKKRDSIIVSGSFGRSGVSELFNKSFILDIIKEYKIPVFIAHK